MEPAEQAAGGHTAGEPAEATAEDEGIFAAGGAGMHPDHPLLARAQQALQKQLLSEQQRLKEELREKQIMLNNAQNKRESVGVELYGFQQNLAKLQLQLEQTHQNHQVINRIRQQTDEDLQNLRRALAENDNGTAAQRAEVEKQQLELDRLAASLRQVEAYNEAMKGEVAVVRRAAYAAEDAVSRAEKDKLSQDLRIDDMQTTLKSMQQQLQLHTAQVEAQAHETRAALETLAEAEAEMATVHFEKKQLVAQWRSTLNAITKRDEALSSIQDAMRDQQQQELSIATEIRGYKRDILKQQLANEQVTGILKKLEGESAFVSKQVEGVLEGQQRLADVLTKLTRSLEHTGTQVKQQLSESKALTAESDAVERAQAKVAGDLRTIEEELLSALSDQTTTEKSSSKTSADIRALRKKVREEELGVVETQNELAKLQVDILNTEAHNTRLNDTLQLLEEELRDKGAAVEKYELEIKRRNDEIEKKTREIDLLNRKLEKMNGGVESEETGPLEATIHNLQREIDIKEIESGDMQRRWIQVQTELVGLQNENTVAAETVTRLRSEQTVLMQKKKRLETTLEGHGKEIRGLDQGMGRLNVTLQRVNALIAENAAARETLAEDNRVLQTEVAGELRGMEEEAAKLSRAIDDSRQQKRDVLADVVETERQVMLWERKLELEKEMRAVLDPTIGQDVVGDMKKEIHRMNLRHTELTRLQEKLMTDIEKALSKRELIGVKGRATMARAKQAAPGGKLTAGRSATSSLASGGATGGVGMTQGQLGRAMGDLERSVRDTQNELAATDSRLASLESQRTLLAGSCSEAEAALATLRSTQSQLQSDLSAALERKYKLLLATSRQQKQAKRYEDMAAGKYKPLLEDASLLDGEITAAGQRLESVLTLCEAVRRSVPQLGTELDKVLCHVAEV